MIAFYSKISGECITGWLTELTDFSRLNTEDGQDYVPVGYYVILKDSFFSGAAGKYAINLKDLSIRKYHSLPSRLNGCCGLDGCDGCNLVDGAENEIGTEKSDCWMPHCAILEPDRVILKDEN